MIKHENKYSYSTSLTAILLAVLMITFSGILFGSRLNSVFFDSELSVTTGIEAPGLYGITRVVMGDPVYQDLLQNPSSMIFNYGFYYSYGLIIKIFGGELTDIPLFSRLITLAGSLTLFIIIFIRLIRESREKRINVAASFVLISVLTGPFIGWWILTARPDLIGIGFEILGFLFLMKFYQNQKAEKSFYFALALFFIAWSFKQTLVIGFPIAFSLAFFNRKYMLMAIGITISVIFLSAPFLVLGNPYIKNTISLPSINPFSIEQVFYVLMETFKTGFYIFIPGFFLVFYLFVARKTHWVKSPEFFLVLIIGISMTWSLITSSRNGSYRNYFFLSYFLTGIFLVKIIFLNGLSVPLLVKQITLGFIVFLFMLLVTVYLIPNQKLSGRVSIVTPVERIEINKLRHEIQTGKGSFFVESEYFALPSFTGVYPAVVIDPALYSHAVYFNLVKSVITDIQNRKFDRLYLNHPYSIQQATIAGYKVTGQFHLLTKMELNEN